MGRLKEVRTEKKLTQQQVADLFGISLRSYKSYENDPVKEGSLKYHYMLEKLAELNPIDEEHGVVDIEYITQKCSEVFRNYEVDFCYLLDLMRKQRRNRTVMWIF